MRGMDKAQHDGATPLHAVAQTGHLEIARLLLEANADKDKDSPLCLCRHWPPAKVVQPPTALSRLQRTTG